MLDPWIIEEIKRREEDKRREETVVRIEVPVHGPAPTPMDRVKPPEDENQRGIVIIDYGEGYGGNEYGFRPYSW